MREGEAGYPLAGGALLVEGATQAPVGEILSTHGVREGEAPTALLVEGATQAPVKENKIDLSLAENAEFFILFLP